VSIDEMVVIDAEMFLYLIKNIRMFQDHPRKANPVVGDWAFFGKRYDIGELRMWNGVEWIYAIAQEEKV
jgi:hypothetical protein